MKNIVPLLDLNISDRQVIKQIKSSVNDIINRKEFILGKEVKQLEEKFSQYCGTKHAIGTNSGSAALEISLLALGIGPGDKVITSPFTFTATAESIIHTGARPVFVDIELETYNMDLNKVEDYLKKNQSPEIKVILPVHLYGHPVDMNSLLAISEKYNLKIIEDACQAHGALVKVNSETKKTGSIGNIGCFSFYPTKNLGAYGDAGMAVTNDDTLADKIRKYANHGRTTHYEHYLIGNNFRLDNIQAAILLIKLNKLEQWNKIRRQIANRYYQYLNKQENIVLPKEQSYAKHVYHQYVIRTKNRDQLKEYLKNNGIMTGIHYPLPLHLQKAYQFLGYRQGDFPNAEKASQEVLSLPMFPGLTIEQQKRIVKHINEFYKQL